MEPVVPDTPSPVGMRADIVRAPDTRPDRPPPPPPIAPKPKILPKAHNFTVRTFYSPVKCMHCTSLMTGLERQGFVCDVCNFACHVGCSAKVPQVCPVPPDQARRPVGIDPSRGIGTAYEGFVRVSLI